MEKVAVPISEAVRAIGVGRTTFYGLLAEGRIKSITVGRRRLVPVEEIHRFVGELLEPSPES